MFITVHCEINLNFKFCIDNLIILRNNDLNNYKININCDSQCAENAELNDVFFSSSKIIFNFRTLMFSNFEEYHNIKTA